MNYAEHLAADRRLCILRVLTELNGSANESVLHDALEHLGHRKQPRDAIREDITYLGDRGLIVIEWAGHLQVCTITRRGVDAAEGRIEVQGVKKPSIGL